MTPKELPIAIVGAGTVGSILIGHFYQAGFENLALVDIYHYSICMKLAIEKLTIENKYCVTNYVSVYM